MNAENVEVEHMVHVKSLDTDDYPVRELLGGSIAPAAKCRYSLSRHLVPGLLAAWPLPCIRKLMLAAPFLYGVGGR